MKQKFKTIIILILALILSLSTIVFAENETSSETTNESTDSEAIAISESQETDEIVEHDEYIFQENIVIDTPIDGNLFLIAKNVTISTQIGGDVFVLADTINIDENAYILNNLFACASNINVKGVIYNIYSIENNLTIDGFIYRDVKTICDTMNINSMIGRDVFARCNYINFKEKSDSEETPSIASYGSIHRNLNYASYSEFSIPEYSVSGETFFTLLEKNTVNISNYMYSLGSVIVSAIVIWLISLWISPKLLHTSIHTLTFKAIAQIIGLGILIPLAIIFISVIILLIPIASPLALLFLCILAILFFISTSIAIIYVNSAVCNKLKVTQNIHKFGFLIITSFIYWVLTLIPFVGIFVSLISIIWGIGTISFKLLIKEKTVITNRRC